MNVCFVYFPILWTDMTPSWTPTVFQHICWWYRKLQFTSFDMGVTRDHFMIHTIVFYKLIFYGIRSAEPTGEHCYVNGTTMSEFLTASAESNLRLKATICNCSLWIRTVWSDSSVDTMKISSFHHSHTLYVINCSFELQRAKTCFTYMRTTKTQIKLRINTDQAAHLCIMIWVFDIRIYWPKENLEA